MSESSHEPLDLFSDLEPDPADGPSGEDLDPGADRTVESSPEPHVWSVSELNLALRTLLEGAFDEVRVTGEIANWTRARSGHCYFTIKDESSQLRCVMWRRDAQRLPLEPEEGMSLRVHGRVTLYEARGELQLQVREVLDEGGEGLWKLAFERLRRTLEAEGLLDPGRKRPLPRFPRTVGVVTSPTGAALRDILSVLRRRAPWTRVLLRGARVQGEGAALELARAIQVLGGSGLVDVVIVARGGGSIEDLWAFNEEPVARAVADCPVPIISAVGHETDVTISDLVADLRAPTPSAGAEAAVQDGGALLEVLDRIRPRLARGLRTLVERRRVQLERRKARVGAGARRLLDPRRSRLARVSDRLGPAARAFLAPRRVRVDRGRERLDSAVRTLIGDRRRRLGLAAGRVEALSPLSTLRRGYAVPLDAGGRVLRGRGDFSEGEDFTLRVVDGRIVCTTKRIATEEVGG